MQTYFILNGQTESGPFTLDSIKGQGITKTTLVRRQDSFIWTTAENIKELAELVIPKNSLPSKTKLHPKATTPKNLSAKKKSYKKSIILLLILICGLSIISIQSVKKDNTPPASVELQLPVNPTEVVINKPAASVRKVDSITTPAKNIEVKKSLPIVRQAVLREESFDRAAYYRNHWTKFITVANSNYGHGLLGGIKGLSVVFSNKSDFYIDELVAKITYVKANGKPWKTKLIPIFNIPPHSDVKQSIARVNRGKSVKVSISQVFSSKMHLSYMEDNLASKEDSTEKSK